MTEQIARGTVVLGPDFSRHRITGSVYHAPAGVSPHIDVPLISHVGGNLWQGGCMGGVRLPDEFNYVLSLYPWEKYTLGAGTERDEVKMYDSLDQALGQVDEIAQRVVARLGDGPTLVHCQAGLNRSGLIAARTLMLLGETAEDAIASLRAARSPLVLCNSAFEEYLLGL